MRLGQSPPGLRERGIEINGVLEVRRSLFPFFIPRTRLYRVQVVLPLEIGIERRDVDGRRLRSNGPAV